MDLFIKRYCQAHGCRCQKIADIFATFVIIIVINMEYQKNTDNTDDRNQKRIKNRHFEFLFQDKSDLVGDQTYHRSKKCGVFMNSIIFQFLSFPFGSLLCHFSCYDHYNYRADKRHNKNRYTDRFQRTPCCDQSCTCRHKHHRHDLNQKICRTFT